MQRLRSLQLGMAGYWFWGTHFVARSSFYSNELQTLCITTRLSLEGDIQKRFHNFILNITATHGLSSYLYPMISHSLLISRVGRKVARTEQYLSSESLIARSIF